MNSTEYYDEKYFNWQKQVGQFGGIANLFKFKDHIRETDAVLDFGCGGGYLLNNLKCREKFGLEVNPIARQEALKTGVHIYENIFQIPDHSLDIIISNHVLEHVKSPLEVLSSLRFKLKPEGKIIFVVPHHKADEPYNPQDINRHLYSWNALTFGTLFNEAGFDVIQAESIQHQWPPNYIDILSGQGEEVFHQKCREHAIQNQTFQIKVIARPKPSSHLTIDKETFEKSVRMINSFTAHQLLPKLKEFLPLYLNNPIQDNQGGLKSVGAFSLWYLLSSLKPKHVIESGVWKGFSTWLIGNAIPTASIDSIDITFEYLQYRSQKANYSNKDFLETEWSGIDKENTVIFFDDHQDALPRAECAKRQGFKYLIFDDNYPQNRGSHMSLAAAKQGYDNTLAKEGNVLNQKMYPHLIQRFESLKVKNYWLIPKLFATESDFYKNSGEIQQEPVFKQPQPGLEIYFQDKETYRWMTFVEL
jgi:SAM-dependent methyltransferase